jgi:hypothetical protein
MKYIVARSEVVPDSAGHEKQFPVRRKQSWDSIKSLAKKPIILIAYVFRAK